MELSQSFQVQVKKLRTTPQYILYADLLSIGYSEEDAYYMAYPENRILAQKAVRGAINSIINTEGFQKVLAERVSLRKIKVEKEEDTDELMNKEATARLIMKAALRQPQDSKERIEGLMKYSDLMGYKKDDVESDGTEAISFYLPLKCNLCPFLAEYNKYLSSKGEKELRPVEMTKIVESADKKVKKMQKATDR